MGMPILERILRRGRAAPDDYGVIAPGINIARDTYDGIKRSTFFDIQVAADVSEQRRDRKTMRLPERLIDENIGLLRPPYPEIFLEWTYSSSGYEGKRIGCYILERFEGGMLTLEAVFIAIYPTRDNPNDDTVREHQMRRFVNVDQAGGLTDWGFDEQRWNRMTEGYQDNDRYQEFLTKSPRQTEYFLFTIVTALALMNCRNVATATSGSINIGRSGAQKRRGDTPQAIRYQTIILPGGGTESDDQGDSRATALHRVRGHFKTFTKEDPLFGKHVGTYWWGWQVRGNPDYGTIISDYELAPDAQAIFEKGRR